MAGTTLVVVVVDVVVVVAVDCMAVARRVWGECWKIVGSLLFEFEATDHQLLSLGGNPKRQQRFAVRGLNSTYDKRYEFVRSYLQFATQFLRHCRHSFSDHVELGERRWC